MNMTEIPIACSWYSHQRIGKGTGGLRNEKTIGDQSNHSSIMISQNTKKIWFVFFV